MTSIKTLEDILHKERIAKYKNVKGIESWDRKYKEYCIKLGHTDLATNNPRKITEWREREKLKRENNFNQQRLKNLQRASNMLYYGSMYPFALLITLFLITNL